MGSRFDATECIKVNPACDLSETAVEMAMETAIGQRADTAGLLLLIGTRSSVIAGRIAERLNLTVVVVPLIAGDGWAVVGERTTVFSEGA